MAAVLAAPAAHRRGCRFTNPTAPKIPKTCAVKPKFDLAHKANCLPTCMDRLVSVVVLQVHTDGRLLYANQGGLFVLNIDSDPAYWPESLAPYFLRPSFGDLLRQAQWSAYHGMVHLGDPNSEMGYSLTGAVSCEGEVLTLVAEHDIAEISALNRQVIQLNAEQAQLQRALSRANRLLQAKTTELERLSTTDPLTGLKNRSQLVQLLAHELDRLCRYNNPVCVVMADLDHFKQVNDDFGHDVGDAVLHTFADVLRTESRTGDTLVRLGGEEFLVVLPMTEAAAAQVCAERIRVAFKAASAARFARPITVSLGVAQGRSEDTALSLLKRVDNALYAAKHAGRDRGVGD